MKAFWTRLIAAVLIIIISFGAVSSGIEFNEADTALEAFKALFWLFVNAMALAICFNSFRNKRWLWE